WSTDSDSYSDVGSDNTPNETVGHKYLDLNKVVATLTSVKKTDGKDTYELSLGRDTINWDETDATEKTVITNFREVKADYNNLKYKTVKVLYKKANEVYGVFATTDNTSNTGLLADLKMDSEKKVKLDGTKYTLAGSNSVYVDGELQTTGSGKDEKNVTIKDWVDEFGKDGTDDFATYKEGSKVELLANNGSSEVSILNVTTYTVEEVDYVGSDYVTAGGKKSEDDYNIADGLKKGDYVVISKAGNYSDGKGLIEKAEVVEGKVDSTKGDKDDNGKVAIDGTWYTMATGVTAPNMGANVKLIVVNGYVYEKDTITAGTSDIALVVETGDSNTVGSKYYQARMIFADGTDKVVDIEKKEDDGTDIDNSKKNVLATFTVSKDVYTLSFIENQTEAENAGYENYTAMAKSGHTAKIDGSIQDTTTSSGAVAKTYLDNAAVVFVKDTDDDYKVVTGKAAANWKSTNLNDFAAVTTADNKLSYAQVAFLSLNAANVPGGSDTTYAVALDDSYKSKIDGTTYTVVKAWNGTEEVTYKSEDSVTLDAGDIFEYSNETDGVVSIEKKNAKAAEVASYDATSGDIVFDINGATSGSEVSSKIDSDDTTILYVDSDKNAGVEGGEIRLGNSYNDSKDDAKNNVSYFVDDGDDYVSVIVVDVNNDYTAW
ncbi:MAG: hypothetical protein KH050_14330, partial [Clostridiaceae bacterium]|nr:hypothetical protein [Clostridiaceae bacterium]